MLAYPARFAPFGYDDSWLASTGIELPATLSQFHQLTSTMQPNTPEQQLNDLNFYGTLIKTSDAHLVQILDTLEEQVLLENTLVIYTSDHGEMGITHGGMIQKSISSCATGDS